MTDHDLLAFRAKMDVYLTIIYCVGLGLGLVAVIIFGYFAIRHVRAIERQNRLLEPSNKEEK